MEYEVKYKIADKKDILRKLRKLKAEDLGKERQLDIYLGADKRMVRLRKAGRGGLVTVKRLVNNDTRAKLREELETKVEDIDKAVAIFEALGFKEVKRKEKIRHTFQLDNMYVLVDRLPFMGYFVELEATKEAALKRMSKKLGFDYRQASGNSYDNLFFEYYVLHAKQFQNARGPIWPIFAHEKALEHK